MQIIVTTQDELILTVECTGEDTVASIKEKVHAQVGIPVSHQVLLYNETVLNDGATLAFIGVGDGDLLMCVRQQQATSSFQRLIDQVKADPRRLSALRTNIPPLAAAVESNDVAAVQDILQQVQQHQQEIAELEKADSFDVDAQKKIEEMIKNKNIQENYQQAMDNMPELYASTTMLYINMKVNGVPVQAFVDTGAQSTIMREDFAEKCSLTRLSDGSWGGTAFGVGQAKILGRVHHASITINDKPISSSLLVLQQKSGPSFIFGLDNLIRNQCVIDLKNQKLIFGSIGEEVPFLKDSEIDETGRRFTVPSAGAAASSSDGNASREKLDEDKIQRLMALGFDRERCIEALKSAQGNEELAASLLYGYV